MWLGGFLTETNWVKPPEMKDIANKTNKTD